MALEDAQASRASEVVQASPAQRKAPLQPLCEVPAGVTRPVTAQPVRRGKGALETLDRAVGKGLTPYIPCN